MDIGEGCEPKSPEAVWEAHALHKSCSQERPAVACDLETWFTRLFKELNLIGKV